MNKELDFVKDMFDKIAPKYDFLNRLLSLRQDVIWRTHMVRSARLTPDCRVLDVACGTCDVALEVDKSLQGLVTAVGLDFSLGMLKLGKKKLQKNKTITLINGDALALPFKTGLFDAVFIAFGIRNIMGRTGALNQFHKVLNQGGRAVVLELTTPQKGILRDIYLAYFQKILPVIGSFFSRHNNAYTYLPESVLNFPSPKQFAGVMKQAGFKDIQYKSMTFGIVSLFVGTKD